MSYLEELNNEITRLRKINNMLRRGRHLEGELYQYNKSQIDKLEAERELEIKKVKCHLKLVVNNQQ